MNLSCAICKEHLSASDDVFSTPCGHLFHFVYISRWLEGSLNPHCPHCRFDITLDMIHRVFFIISNDDDEDPTSLQHRIVDLIFPIVVKDRYIKFFCEEEARHRTLTEELGAEVRKLNSNIDGLNSTIAALNERTKHIEEHALEGEEAMREVFRLEVKIETYEKKLSNSAKRGKELRDRIKGLHQELGKVSAERSFFLKKDVKIKQLEEDLAKCEGEKRSLQSRIRELERSTVSGSSSIKNGLTTDIEAPKRLDDAKEDKKDSDLSLIILSPSDSEQKPGAEKSPYMPVKSQGIVALGDSKMSSRLASTSQTSTSGVFSILPKKPRLTEAGEPKARSEEIVYNPSPITSFKTKKLNACTSSMKLTRRKVVERSNKLTNCFDPTKPSSPKSEFEVV